MDNDESFEASQGDSDCSIDSFVVDDGEDMELCTQESYHCSDNVEYSSDEFESESSTSKDEDLEPADSDMEAYTYTPTGIRRSTRISKQPERYVDENMVDMYTEDADMEEYFAEDSDEKYCSTDKEEDGKQESDSEEGSEENQETQT